jgi:hypothetical protein
MKDSKPIINTSRFYSTKFLNNILPGQQVVLLTPTILAVSGFAYPVSLAAALIMAPLFGAVQRLDPSHVFAVTSVLA